MERVLLAIVFLFTITNASLDVNMLRLLSGWNAQIVTNSVPNVRQLALTPDESIVFAGSSGPNVYAVPITKQGNLVVSQNGSVHILIQNQVWPHGVAFDPTTNDLYFSSNYTSVFKFPNIINNLNNPPTPIVIFDKFPNSTAYPTKHLRFNKDYSRIYTSQGSSCDHCIFNYTDNPPSFYATLVSFAKNGTGLITHAYGVRNVVGLAFNPNVLNELWFSDSTRNGLGIDIPPAELNKLPNADQIPNPPPNYGFPFCYGKNFSDYTLNGTCLPSYIPAQYLVTAHSLPLGITFSNNSVLPAGTVLIAQRGSPGVPYTVGFKVVMFNINDPASTETVFVDGWLQNTTYVIGRPVDVVQMKDGSFLVADEQSGAIVRIYYQPPSPSSIPSPGSTPVSPSIPSPGSTPVSPSIPSPGSTPVSPSIPSPGSTPVSPSIPSPGSTPVSPSSAGRRSAQIWFILFVCVIALTFVEIK